MKSNFRSVLKFALPAILMQMCLSLYTIIDGMFISRFQGEITVGAINVIFPYVSLIMAVGVMVSTGGAAYVSKKLGEGRCDDGRRNTTLLFIYSIIMRLLKKSMPQNTNFIS